MTQIVSLSFYRFSGFSGRAWALMMMGAARPALARTPDIKFWKLCGAGKGEGFNPTVNPYTIAILATWDSAELAQDRTANTPIFQRYRKRSVEDWTVFLQPRSVRGAWGGSAPFTAADAPADGPMAALTRASIRKSAILQFWKQVPDISANIGADPNVMFKAGIGELPMLDQITFSIWPDKATMDGFARTGPHGAAIKAVRAGNWFSEELFARFAVHSDRGTWNGTSPLAKLSEAA